MIGLDSNTAKHDLGLRVAILSAYISTLLCGKVVDNLPVKYRIFVKINNVRNLEVGETLHLFFLSLSLFESVLPTPLHVSHSL